MLYYVAAPFPRANSQVKWFRHVHNKITHNTSSYVSTVVKATQKAYLEERAKTPKSETQAKKRKQLRHQVEEGSDKYFLVTRGTATQHINYTFTLGLKSTAPHTPKSGNKFEGSYIIFESHGLNLRSISDYTE